jgi:hypothetical protein
MEDRAAPTFQWVALLQKVNGDDYEATWMYPHFPKDHLIVLLSRLNHYQCLKQGRRTRRPWTLFLKFQDTWSYLRFNMMDDNHNDHSFLDDYVLVVSSKVRICIKHKNANDRMIHIFMHILNRMSSLQFDEVQSDPCMMYYYMALFHYECILLRPW